MVTPIALICVAALLAVAAFSVFVGRRPEGSRFVYGAALLITTIALVAALVALVAGAATSPSIVLPLGLPWVGAHFRVDALSAFFLIVVNLGAAAASLYGL